MSNVEEEEDNSEKETEVNLDPPMKTEIQLAMSQLGYKGQFDQMPTSPSHGAPCFYKQGSGDRV